MATNVEKKQREAAFILAEYVNKTRYEDLPKEVVDATKKSILDTLGATIAGSTLISECKTVVDMVKEAGGKQESTILAFGGKVPAWMAAYANGAMSHGLDYDDVHHDAVLHPGVQTIPAALATAERVGGVNGKEFITAIALGEDIISRLGLSIQRRPKGWKQDWLPSIPMGVFSSAAAASKIMGLNTDKVIDALGIAFTQAAGTMELCYGVGSVLRAMYPAFTGLAGTLSACMAQRGITGVKTSLDGKAGFFNVYFEGEYDRKSLIGELGKKFEGVNMGLKPWPACGFTHVFLDGILGLRSEHDILPDDIESITVGVSEIASALCQPIEDRRKPKTILDAKFSIPFCVAIAAVEGAVRLKDFIPERLTNPAVLDMAEKVMVKLDSRLGGSDVHGLPAGEMEIRTKDGKTYSRRVEIPYGHQTKPMTMEDIVAKFKDCVSFSATPVSTENVDKVIEMCLKLEDLADINQIVQLLS